MPYVILPVKALPRPGRVHRNMARDWGRARDSYYGLVHEDPETRKNELNRFGIEPEDITQWGMFVEKPEIIPEGGTLRFFPTWEQMSDVTERERAREGHKPLPWYQTDEPDVPWHGLDTNTDMPWRPTLTPDGMVHFFPDWIRCIENRPEIVTIGRFLRVMWDYYDDVHGMYTTNRYGPLTDELVQQWSVIPKGQTPEDVFFATTADEIEKVYRNGPSSCMSHATSDYSTAGVHPTRAYAGHGLAVAALPNRKVKGKWSQRALVWPEKKVYSTIYGTGKLEDFLKALGYTAGSFHGAKMSKLWVEGSDAIVMPWLDNQPLVLDMGKYLRIHAKTTETEDGLTLTDLAFTTKRPAWSPRSTTSGAVPYYRPCAKCGKKRTDRNARLEGNQPVCTACVEKVERKPPTRHCACGLARYPVHTFKYVMVNRDATATVRRMLPKHIISGVGAGIASCCVKAKVAAQLANDGGIIVANPLYKEPHAESENTADHAPIPATDGVTDGAELS